MIGGGGNAKGTQHEVDAPAADAQAETDAHLVRATVAGDVEAFGRLYDRYAALVRAICGDEIGGDVAQTQDLAQEAFLRAYRKLAGLREADRFAPWLIGVTRHVCREWRRSAGRRRKTWMRFSREVPENGQAAIDEPSANIDQLRSAIASLPDREREALHMFYLQDRPADDAARLLGMSRSGFYRAIDRARDRLRKMLGGAS
jgi:RNA polymerase sigma-70 factor (ECF subfamily)